MKRLLLICTVLCYSCCVYAQDSLTKKLPFTFSAAAAPEWTKLFERTSGWFGADGIFSIPLSGADKNDNEGNDSTLLIFSDTYIGEVKDGKPVNDTMINNTIAYIKGNDPDVSKIHFHYNTDANGKPVSFFTPQTSTTAKPQLFWLGDGFVNKERDNTLYIFGYKVERTGAGVFDFIEPGVSIIAIPKGSKPPFNKQRQVETSLHINNKTLGEGNMGAGILVNTTWSGAPSPDGYVYVYGCTGNDKNLIAARVKPKDFEKLDEWKYWNGTGWSNNKDDMKPITNAVSNELNVTPMKNGKYILVFQVMGLSDKVGVRIGDSPVGPFSDIIEVWKAPEWDKGLWTYNAKAHPNLSKPGELLISYNTITPDFWNDIKKDATIYHPRFIRLKVGEK
ncbi:MAG TPA: DUF5005 domain-containing protein [Parafilimonas sp.]|nr:DUF5005 domain-containing protein [Parafilimonas sp.]